MCWIVQTVSVRDDPMGSMIQVMSMLFVPLSLTTPTRAWARHTGQSQMLFTLIGSAGHTTSPTGLRSTTSHTGYTDMETTTSSHAARRPILFPVIGPMPSHMGMVCNTAAATTGANTTTKTIQISAAQIDASMDSGSIKAIGAVPMVNKNFLEFKREDNYSLHSVSRGGQGQDSVCLGKHRVLSPHIPPPPATASRPGVTLVGDDYVTAIRRITHKSAEKNQPMRKHSILRNKQKQKKGRLLPCQIQVIAV